MYICYVRVCVHTFIQPLVQIEDATIIYEARIIIIIILYYYKITKSQQVLRNNWL